MWFFVFFVVEFYGYEEEDNVEYYFELGGVYVVCGLGFDVSVDNSC